METFLNASHPEARSSTANEREREGGIHLDSVELIRRQIELEYTVSADGLLVPFPGSTEQSRFIIYRHENGYITYLRHDLPVHVRQDLRALPADQAFNDRDVVKRILADDAICDRVFIGRSYFFSYPPTPDQYPDAVRLNRTPLSFAVVVSGRIVSTCESVRENDASAEAYVYTESAFRRRGYGKQVTAAWAQRVMQKHKIAFYSCARDNIPSQALAQGLGLVRYASVVVYD